MKRGVSVNDFESVEFVAKTQCKIVEEVFESLKGKNSEDSQILTRKEEDVHFFNSSLEGPAMGVTFFKSTLEGRVPLKAAAFLATVICRMFKVNEEQRRAHAPKKLAIDASCRRLFFFRMKEQSFIGHAFFLPFYFLFKKWKKSGEMESLSLLPEKQTLSLQKCGEVFIITCPGEFTLQSGRRMENIVRETFKSSPLKNNKILLIGYTNGHGSYVTTEEEYLLQRYEGASTLYGRKTLQHYEEALYRLATGYLSESEANERKGVM